jgi:hypothetical protein
MEQVPRTHTGEEMTAATRHISAPIRTLVAAGLIWTPLAMFLVIRLVLLGDGAQIALDYTRITVEGFMVKPFAPAPGGLRAGDVVVAVEGRSIDDWLHDAATGQWGRAKWNGKQALGYTVARDGRVMVVAVPLTPYPLGPALAEDWSFYLFLVYQVTISLLIFVRRPQLEAARLLFLASNAYLTASVMVFLNFQVSDLLQGWFVQFVLWANLILAYYANPTILHFTLIFPRRHPVLARHPALLIWVYLGIWLVHIGFILIRLQAAPTLAALFQLHWQAGFFASGVYLLLVPLIYVPTYRSSRPAERRQVRWILWGTVVGVIPWTGTILAASLFGLPWRSYGAYLSLFLAAIPTAYAIAIVRERLFDIDVIIRRTLVYGVLTAALALVYFSNVVVLQGLSRLVTGQQQPEAVTVLSTLAIAALFTPLRRRVQAFIDRRFYRRKYDAARTLAAFSNTIRDEVELGRLAEHLTQVVDETLQPATVSLWLKGQPAPLHAGAPNQLGSLVEPHGTRLPL